MAHKIDGRKLGRKMGPRLALYKNLTVSVLRYERVKTTEAKAKEVRPIVEQMITLGKRGDVAAHRQAVAFLRSKEIAHILFAEIAPRFADRPGGYTRIVKIGPRQGDAARMAYLELVDYVPRAAGVPAAAAAASAS
jgi:large subunit ribosomal protein L17